MGKRVQKQSSAILNEDFRSLTKDELFSRLKSSEQGLTDEEMDRRLKKYGPNELPKKQLLGLRVFFRQFKSPLLWILMGAVVVSIFFGEIQDSLIILGAILLSSLLSFYDEYKSEKIVEKLNKKIAHKAIVMRNGEKNEVRVNELVCGDIVYLSLGSVVPADIRILESKGLEINESALTGESLPVDKQETIIKGKVTRLQELKNYVFAGTVVAAGEARGIVIRTGVSTEIGAIAQATTQERPQTEFQKGLTQFGGLLMKVIILLVVGIFLVNSLFKHDWLGSLLFALAIAIGITPELLPAVISVGLSKGAHKMSKKDVLVKRLVSIEDFGNMDVLCTDKTGTLTEGTLSVTGHIDSDGKTSDEVLVYGLLCNESIMHGKKIIGTPIDAALRRHAHKEFEGKLREYETLDALPFDYERKRMSVVVRKGKGKPILITKGAVQSVLGVCSKIKINGKIYTFNRRKKELEQSLAALADEGLRVIAVAEKELPHKNNYSVKEERKMTFIGYITLLDPPKKGIKESIDKLASLGVRFKILTGDNERVTKKIAEQVDIQLEKILLAEDIDGMSDSALKKAVEETHAFCRLTPEQKLRVIKALRANGHDVGYMGDGVNDVPALHEADVGISVDDAVDVAKEASDIILLRKSIDSLAEGVLEGRRVFSNTLKYILMDTSSNFGNMFSAAGASIFLKFLPMLPTQILLVNLLYDASQLSLPSDNVDKEELKKPKHMDMGLVKKYMLVFGPISSAYDFLTYGVMIFVFGASAALFRTGWFIESMMTQLFVVFVIRTRKSPFWKSKPGKWLVISSLLVASVALILPFTSFAQVLGFERPPLGYFIFLLGAVVTYLAITEVFKKWFFKKYAKN